MGADDGLSADLVRFRGERLLMPNASPKKLSAASIGRVRSSALAVALTGPLTLTPWIFVFPLWRANTSWPLIFVR